MAQGSAVGTGVLDLNEISWSFAFTPQDGDRKEGSPERRSPASEEEWHDTCDLQDGLQQNSPIGDALAGKAGAPGAKLILITI
jgi:hypothetical protein